MPLIYNVLKPVARVDIYLYYLSKIQLYQYFEMYIYHVLKINICYCLIISTQCRYIKISTYIVILTLFAFSSINVNLINNHIDLKKLSTYYIIYNIKEPQ